MHGARFCKAVRCAPARRPHALERADATIAAASIATAAVAQSATAAVATTATAAVAATTTAADSTATVSTVSTTDQLPMRSLLEQ